MASRGVVPIVSSAGDFPNLALSHAHAPRMSRKQRRQRHRQGGRTIGGICVDGGGAGVDVGGGDGFVAEADHEAGLSDFAKRRQLLQEFEANGLTHDEVEDMLVSCLPRVFPLLGRFSLGAQLRSEAHGPVLVWAYQVRQCGNLQRTRFALVEAYASRLPRAMVENYKSAALSAREVMNFVPARHSKGKTYPQTGQPSSTTTFGTEHSDDAEYHREQARVAARAMQRIIKEKMPRTVNQRGTSVFSWVFGAASVVTDIAGPELVRLRSSHFVHRGYARPLRPEFKTWRRPRRAAEAGAGSRHSTPRCLGTGCFHGRGTFVVAVGMLFILSLHPVPQSPISAQLC